MSEGNYLVHYASKYYDPVKAHEYYMRHRQLSGNFRKSYSTTKMNATGQKAFAYVNNQINKKRDAAIKSNTERLQSQTTGSITARKAEVIRALSDKTKNLSHYEKRKLAIQLQQYVQNARKTLNERTALMKQEVESKYNKDRAKEYDKINKEFQKKQIQNRTTKLEKEAEQQVTYTPTSSGSQTKTRTATTPTRTLANTIRKNRYYAIRNKKYRR